MTELEAVKKELEELQMKQGGSHYTVDLWLKEHNKNDQFVPISNLYIEYVAFCDKNAEKFNYEMKTRVAFSRRLYTLGFKRLRLEGGETTVTAYNLGEKLTQLPESPSEGRKH